MDQIKALFAKAQAFVVENKAAFIKGGAVAAGAVLGVIVAGLITEEIAPEDPFAADMDEDGEEDGEEEAEQYDFVCCPILQEALGDYPRVPKDLPNRRVQIFVRPREYC